LGGSRKLHPPLGWRKGALPTGSVRRRRRLTASVGADGRLALGVPGGAAITRATSPIGDRSAWHNLAVTKDGPRAIISSMTFAPTDLEHPIVLAPMAGGPSTLALAAAVADAGGLGFLASGYKTPDAVAEDIGALRSATGGPFGVNVFVPAGAPAEPEVVEGYASRLCDAGLEVGEPRWDDDAFEGKLEVLVRERPEVVSFTFGLPPRAAVEALQDADCAVWITITTQQEAARAAAAGADALVCQGVEAGGHRGGLDHEAPGDLSLLALLQLVPAVTDLPLIATGGIVTGRGVAGALAAGAVAVQLGTAFMRSPEAGTVPAHREALTTDRPTALTRAFSGRTARGIVNRFMLEHEAAAPLAYPEVHHLTSPPRAAARSRGDAENFNLWAGQAHALATDEPAGDVVRRLSREARDRLGR
jgi:nitronate monooxygenase